MDSYVGIMVEANWRQLAKVSAGITASEVGRKALFNT